MNEPMNEPCHVPGCENTAYDNCSVCNEPTCNERHGEMIDDNFVCNDCAENF